MRPTTYMTKYNLTEREFEVLELLAKGYSNKDICKKLCIEYTTVASHKDKIYQKLNTHGSCARAKAIIKYYHEGFDKSALINIEELKKAVDQTEEQFLTEIEELKKENSRIKIQNKSLQAELKTLKSKLQDIRQFCIDNALHYEDYNGVVVSTVDPLIQKIYKLAQQEQK